MISNGCESSQYHGGGELEGGYIKHDDYYPCVGPVVDCNIPVKLDILQQGKPMWNISS
jgi:hypothetical protein